MVALRSRIAVLLTVTALFAPLVHGQSQQESRFYRAYYLEHELGDLEGAKALYEEVADDRKAPKELRAEARAQARALGEDLAASDFARLMPPDTIFYAELSQPGEQIKLLLDQLGLLGRFEETGKLGVSPLLVDGLLGMRGAAVAITEIDHSGGPPNGVLVLHPGDLDIVRGLIETALPAGGQPAKDIGDHPTWSIEGQVYVTMTSRLLIASPDPRQIEGVIARLENERMDSLADDELLREALGERDGLLTFCLNTQPIMPMIQGMLAEDPEAAMALAFLDPGSLRYVAGHFGIDEDGVGLDLVLQLDEGHHSLAFNLLRAPHVGRETLDLIPEGSAFFLAMAVNPEGDVPPMLTDASGAPVVTFMDFGREIFGNLVDVAIYGASGSADAPTGPIPDIAAVLRVNDVERSKALWGFGLGVAGMVGGSGGPQQTKIAGRAVDVYDAGGVPLHLAADGNRLIVSPSRAAVQQALETTKRGGRSVMDDPAFAGSLKGFENKSTLVLAANAGRCMQLAGATHAPEEAMIADLLSETVVAARIEHTDTRLAFRARVSHIPDVSGLVVQALGSGGAPSGLINGGGGGAGSGSGNGGGREALRATFDELSGNPGTREAALAVGKQILVHEADDPLFLNNFAWALITEEQYGGDYLDLARGLAEQANAVTDHQNWYYLDTLALIEFQSGHLEKAVKLERRAVELSAGDPRGAEAEKQLAAFEAALSKAAVGSR